MCFLTELEEKTIVPILTAEFRNNPGGVTIDELEHAINKKGIALSRSRMIQICTTLEWSGFCSLKRVAHNFVVIPSGDLYANPIMVN